MIGVAQICRKVWLTAHRWWSMMYRLLQSISSCQRLNSLPLSILNCRLVPLSTSGPLCKGLPPKPRLPGFGYNRSQMVYKQHKQFKFVFDGEDRVKNIWEDYQRNHKGPVPPQRTRLRCRSGKSSACPLCRRKIKDIKYTDVTVLKQFIDEHTGQVIRALITGLCRTQQKKVEAAVEKAYDYGYLSYTIPITNPPYYKPVEASFKHHEIPWNKINTDEY